MSMQAECWMKLQDGAELGRLWKLLSRIISMMILMEILVSKFTLSLKHVITIMFVLSV